MKVIVHKFCLGDVEDPCLLATMFITTDFPKKPEGKQLAEFNLDPTSYRLCPYVESYGYQVEVICDQADPEDVYLARLSGLTLDEIS